MSNYPVLVPRQQALGFMPPVTDALIVSEIPKKTSTFIEANTLPVELHHLTQDCIVPCFADMTETISHQTFIDAVTQAARDYFTGNYALSPAEIRVSHPINGRIPSALGKSAKDLTEEEKTVYYQRMAFSFEIPGLTKDINGNTLALSITGVRAYNEINLYGRKTIERFKLAIGFRNRVCTNLMLTTDGVRNQIEVLTPNQLYQAALRLFNSYDPARDIRLFESLGSVRLSETEFCQLVGRMRLYQALPPKQQRALPPLLLGDSQINAACRAYISDPNFKARNSSISGWQLLNLLNGAAKSSYIDNLLERNVNCTDFVQGVMRAKQGYPQYAWFLG